MSRIKPVKNPENKPIDQLVKEELAKDLKEEKQITWADLKIKKRKPITDKYMVWYLDHLLLTIIDATFVDVTSEMVAFIRHIQCYENKGYYIDNWISKYQTIIARRSAMKGIYL